MSETTDRIAEIRARCEAARGEEDGAPFCWDCDEAWDAHSARCNTGPQLWLLARVEELAGALERLMEFGALDSTDDEEPSGLALAADEYVRKYGSDAQEREYLVALVKAALATVRATQA